MHPFLVLGNIGLIYKFDDSNKKSRGVPIGAPLLFT